MRSFKAAVLLLGFAALLGGGTIYQMFPWTRSGQIISPVNYGDFVQVPNSVLATQAIGNSLGGFGSFQNFLINSTCLDCTGWTATNVTTAEIALKNPYGGTSFDNDLTSTSAGGYISQFFDTGTALTGRTFTLSLWLKVPSSPVTSRITILSNPGSVIAASGTVSVTTSWQRFSISGTFSATADTQVGLRLLPVDAGTGLVYAWGLQLEESPTAGQPCQTGSYPIQNRFYGYCIAFDEGAFPTAVFTVGSSNLPTTPDNLIVLGDNNLTGAPIVSTAAVIGTDNLVSGSTNPSYPMIFGNRAKVSANGTVPWTYVIGDGAAVGQEIENDVQNTICITRGSSGKASAGKCAILVNNSPDASNPGSVAIAKYASATNCASSASPAVCSSADAGSAVIAAAATSVVVDTTAVTAISQIFITEDASLGSRLSVTCNTQSSLVLGTPRVTARVAATSFTVSVDVGPTANPLCFNYFIVN